MKSSREKLELVGKMLRIPLRTIIFCDSIKLGKKISSKFNIPFVYGSTKRRMELMRGSRVLVVSRVGDEGISLPSVERIIEVSYLGGSRRQSIQRVGRTFHSTKEPIYELIMTEDEFKKYQKRVWVIEEKGIHVEIIR